MWSGVAAAADHRVAESTSGGAVCERWSLIDVGGDVLVMPHRMPHRW
jgi:hypothetical protein